MAHIVVSNETKHELTLKGQMSLRLAWSRFDIGSTPQNKLKSLSII